ncbi:MAG TPA: pyrroloquinoline quinone-dependent dehydrogenase [Vicinamibacterales bacterium]|nr:pyrroloquinoline quinone-dependent dehydrogenase [Vicinamibacterales bacterium]
MTRTVWLLVLGVAAVVGVRAQQPSTPQVEWRHYGGDPGGMRYSPLTGIDAPNLSRLQVAWQWKHWETALKEYGTTPGQFESTPLMIDGTLYVTTPYNSIAALDAETGQERWRFDGHAYELGQLLSGSGWKLRGTAFWRDGGELRIFLNSRHRLVQLDARTGKPVTTFGNGGAVSLTDGLPRISDVTHASQSSPPVVYRDLVIVGSQVPDRVQLPDPMGYVQAFNARTGRRVWTFSVIPQSAKDPGAETWENESWRRNGHANVWAPMALDEPRGLIYLPTSTPTSDYYGGGRPGANLFAESLVCLDAATGQMKWHFQTVHHGLWDWDLPTQPNLVTLTVGGRRIDAVAQVTKRGDTFVFDRVTGAPVWPIEERPVPTDTDVPGEKPYPTQPFPTRPRPFVDQGVTQEDANNLTPEIRRLAQDEMRKFRIGPIFTPPSLKGTLQRPSQGGGANWGGAAFDPETGYLIVRANNAVGVNRVAKNDGSDPLVGVDYSHVFAGRTSATLPGGLPLVSPPYAVLAAIDLNRGEIVWKVPLGDNPAVRNHPLLKGVALPDRLGSSGNSGGAMVTRSGLVFIGGGDGYFYAFETKTGREVWREKIPYASTANPMTYRTQSGKQFIVMATGTGENNALLAFTVK